jgi:hypothetical protein
MPNEKRIKTRVQVHGAVGTTSTKFVDVWMLASGCVNGMTKRSRIISMTGAMSSSRSVGERRWWMTETWAEPCDVTVIKNRPVVTSVKRTLTAGKTLGPTFPHWRPGLYRAEPLISQPDLSDSKPCDDRPTSAKPCFDGGPRHAASFNAGCYFRQ